MFSQECIERTGRKMHDGYIYPDGEIIEKIESWPLEDGADNLLKFVHKNWWMQSLSKRNRKKQTWVFRTGGWSGNQELITALGANNNFWSLCWKSSHRGGRYKFDYSRAKQFKRKVKQ